MPRCRDLGRCRRSRPPAGCCCLTLPCPCVRIRYFLQPRDNGSKSLKPGDLGSLRLNVVYTEDHVFSSDYYSPLRDLLLKSADVEVPVCPLAHAALPTCGPVPSGLFVLRTLRWGEGPPDTPARRGGRAHDLQVVCCDPEVMGPPLTRPGAGCRGGEGTGTPTTTTQAQVFPPGQEPRLLWWEGAGALLLHACPPQPVSASAAHILGEVCREKQEAAVPLVRLLLHYGRVVPFISAIRRLPLRSALTSYHSLDKLFNLCRRLNF